MTTRMKGTAATKTTTASRPILENLTKISHAELAALLDPARARAHASRPAAGTREKVLTSKPRQRSSQPQHRPEGTARPGSSP
jgi:hypothetical protein